MRCEGFACEELLEDGTKLLGCDTIYAVNKEHFLKDWQKISSADELLEIVSSYEMAKDADVVITGGEPLLYADSEILTNFLQALHVDKRRVTFETNGSLDVDFEKYPVYKKVVFSISVKLSNSGEALKKRLKIPTLKNIISNTKESYFKFVLDAKNIQKLNAEIEDIASNFEDVQIYCMAMGEDREKLARNSEAVVELCKEKGYNFSDRLHIQLWDKKKGI
jgi:organic radical activating enzyme